MGTTLARRGHLATPQDLTLSRTTVPGSTAVPEAQPADLRQRGRSSPRGLRLIATG